MTIPLVQAIDLRKTYELRGGLFAARRTVNAVDGVSFDVMPGEALGLVGESGSGKSTVGKLVLRLEEATSGDVRFADRSVFARSPVEMREIRRKMQVVFQDPYSSLNPRMRVGRFVGEPFVVHDLAQTRSELDDRVAGLFRLVGLDPAFATRYPHEFSGGQRQRLCIARALALEPSFLVADEPITALDVSIQAQIVNLFQDLQERFGLAYLFIAHDLSMVRYLCQRVAVMLRGRIVEIGPTEAIFGDPRHDYTRALLSSVPIPDPDLERQRIRIMFDADAQASRDFDQMSEVSPGHFVG
jgi:peptide/nickel transport system ATP-binding protein